MNKDIKIPPAPTVYCPKDGKEVPCWYCLGSVTQGREICPYLVRAVIHGAESAEVECNWEKEIYEAVHKGHKDASPHLIMPKLIKAKQRSKGER